MVACQPSQMLFEKAQAGDRDAFQELVGRFSERLRNQIRARMGRRLRERLELDDLHQETLLRALKSIGRVTWDGEERFYRWLSSIAEHLILVVDAGNLVHNMHQAYERLQFGETSYGVFVSGPSKTADIEQSLVIGAQGPRSLHVFWRG